MSLITTCKVIWIVFFCITFEQRKPVYRGIVNRSSLTSRYHNVTRVRTLITVTIFPYPLRRKRGSTRLNLLDKLRERKNPAVISQLHPTFTISHKPPDKQQGACQIRVSVAHQMRLIRAIKRGGVNFNVNFLRLPFHPLAPLESCH